MKLSILIPAYNEKGTIKSVIGRLVELKLDGIEKEIVIVDDGSTDGTREILKGVSSDGIRVVFHEKNRGKGSAIRTAIENSTGDYVIIQDADLEYDPGEIPKLLDMAVSGNYGAVYGSRFYHGCPADDAFAHYLGNRLLTGISNLFSGLKLTDMETCYKLLKREYINRISIVENRFGLEPEITAKMKKAGALFVEVPINYSARSYKEGKKIGAKDALRAVFCIVKYNVF